MTLLPRGLVLLTLCALLAPVAADAQVGKRPDPESPAGVEYQLPLEEARKKTAGPAGKPRRGEKSNPARAAAKAPLFGAGVVAAGAGSGASGAGQADGRGGGNGERGDGSVASRQSGDGGDRGEDGSGSSRSVAKGAPLAASAGGENSATGTIVGIALAVLLAGALLGLILRRGLRTSGE